VRDTEREARAELARITNVRSSAAGYDNYQQWLSGTKLEAQMSIDEYSVTNRGLRPGFVGTPERISERIEQFADAGLDLLLLQCGLNNSLTRDLIYCSCNAVRNWKRWNASLLTLSAKSTLPSDNPINRIPFNCDCYANFRSRPSILFDRDQTLDGFLAGKNVS